MNWRLIRVVYRKELLDALRDRRTLISTIIVPMLVFPLLIFGFGSLAAKSVLKAQKEGSTVMIIGSANAPGLVEAIRKTEGMQIIKPYPGFREAISDKKLRVAVEVPAGFEQNFTTGATNQPEVKLYYHAGEMRSQFALRTVQKALRDYSDAIVVQRLRAKGLSPDALKPFITRDENVAPPEKVGGSLVGGMIPYLIIFLCFVGAMTPAIDVTAGEKERGTIETILASPINRMDLATGKFLMVLTASLVTTLLSLVSYSVSLSLPFMAARQMTGGAGSPFQFNLSASAIAAVFVLVVPLAFMFAAGLLALALYAKSYKEAQSYAQPLLIVVIFPAMAAMLPGYEITTGLAFIPIMNVTLVSKELLTGTYTWSHIIIVLGSSCLYAALAVMAARSAFNRESVLFRT